MAAGIGDGERLCDNALTSVRTQLKDTQDLADATKVYSDLLRRQRDDAYKVLDRQGPTLPWYFWTTLGAAAMGVAMELRK